MRAGENGAEQAMSVQSHIDFFNARLDEAAKIMNQPNFGGQMRGFAGALVEDFVERIWVEETGGSVKKEKFTAYNTRGDQLEFEVDKICYTADERLRMVCECKNYLERTYLQRADNDFAMIKGAVCDDAVKTVIFTLEFSLPEDSWRFYMGRRNVDAIFHVMEGRRNSNKPLWHPKHRKPINPDLLGKFIDYVRVVAEI